MEICTTTFEEKKLGGISVLLIHIDIHELYTFDRPKSWATYPLLSMILNVMLSTQNLQLKSNIDVIELEHAYYMKNPRRQLFRAKNKYLALA